MSTSSKGQPRKKERGLSEEFAGSLKDVVRLVTACHRVGCGQLCWLSWRRKKTAMLYVANASTAIAMTPAAARALLPCMQRHEPQHLQHYLKAQLVHGALKDIGTCYLYPSVRSHVEHISGCDYVDAGKELYHRHSTWDASYTATGTRQRDSAASRFNQRQKKEVIAHLPMAQWAEGQMAVCITLKVASLADSRRFNGSRFLVACKGRCRGSRARHVKLESPAPVEAAEEAARQIAADAERPSHVRGQPS